MNQKIILLKVVLAFSLLSFSALGQNLTGQNSGSTLKAERWTLVSIDGKQIQNNRPFVQFDLENKRFSGNAGCNRMFGNLQIDQNEIKFSEIKTNRMLCQNATSMQLESNLVKTLEKVDRFKQTGNMLRLYAGNKLVLKLFGTINASTENQNSAIANVNLENRKWALTEISGSNLPKTKSVPFVVFDSRKKSATGNAGCNSFGGNYKIENNQISFSQTVATQRACAETELMNVENEFLQNLQQANRFEITNKKLYLYENTKLLLVLTEQEIK